MILCVKDTHAPQLVGGIVFYFNFTIQAATS